MFTFEKVGMDRLDTTFVIGDRDAKGAFNGLKQPNSSWSVLSPVRDIHRLAGKAL
jgi:hypothetical protein